MPGPRYSKLETNSTGDDDLDFQSDMGRRHRSEKSNSLWLTTAVAFLLGIVVTLATINVWNHIGKRDTDWLSKEIAA